jgi:hypothetical protein
VNIGACGGISMAGGGVDFWAAEIDAIAKQDRKRKIIPFNPFSLNPNP